jgi:dsDNA-specific endonuclease/ATPase MutS2
MAESNAIRTNVENAAKQASESVQQAASTAADKAQEMASSAGKRADEATTALGERVQSMAGTLRERGPQEGMLGNATGAVADRLDSAGRYLQEEGLMGMAEDVTEFIRRNPIPAVFVGIGLGFLLARILRR